MRDDIGLGDLQMIEQRDGVARQRVEMQLGRRLGRFTKTDLIRHHYAVAGVNKRFDDGSPIARREIAAMQQHHGAAVRLRRGNVHIGHPQWLAVIDQRQHADGVGIGKTFKADAVGLALRRFRGRGRDERQEEEGEGRKRRNENTVHRRLQRKD
jgi:hypothetical protein